ncbi:hypothetical protein PMAYCL1PPCAC_03593, partial [Pristionchus mayeri]
QDASGLSARAINSRPRRPRLYSNPCHHTTHAAAILLSIRRPTVVQQTMADNAPTTGGHPVAHTPQQTPRAAEPTGAAEDASVFKMSAPWSNFLPNTTLFSSLTEGVFGPSPTADYEKKVITFPEWMPPTPAGDSAPSSVVAAATACDSPPDGLLRPQPQYKPEAAAAAAAVSFLAAASPRASKRSESPIDVVNTSAFAPVDQSPTKEDGPVEIVRPQPMRLDSMDTSNSLLMFSSESQQQPSCPATLASALGLPSDTVLFPTEPGPSSGEQSNNSPPSKGCYTRAPGLGPPPETPTSTNDKSAYVCAVCGFSCASKFHYNSHMNTHGDHQCTMCDYTSRTEGRLKKHMRESHTVEQQRAAGLEVSPPPAAPAAAAAASSTNSSPSKENTSSPMEEESGDVSVETPGALSIPTSLSSTLLSMIATSTASSMTSALEQMRAITEQPLLGDGSKDGVLLVGTLLPMREEGVSGGGGGTGGGGRRKAKIYKCKQCPIISQTKEDSWAHARTHIPSDKQMSCDKCGFVTEYKHHLEYHQRNHAGIKPFQCKKCAYTCVNKSMLNSHMKSHSNVYQFRCADCNYATKYCHSLKLHLKKYGHRRNTEGLTEAELLSSLSAESSPPTMRKDSTASIASSLSGPFTPFGIVKMERPPTPTPTMPSFNLQSIATPQNGLSYASQLQNLLNQHRFQQMMDAQPTHKCGFCDFTCGSNEELVRHNITHLLTNGNFYQALGVQASIGIPDRSGEDDHHTTTGSPSGDDAVSNSNGSAGSPLGSGRGSSDEGEGGSSRRKSSKPSRIIGIDELGQALMDKASPDTTVAKVDIKQEEAMDTDESAGATADITTSSAELVLPAPQPLQPAPQQQNPLQQLLQLQQGGLLAAAGENPMQTIRQMYVNHLTNNMNRPGDMFTYVCHFCTLGYANKTLHQTHMSLHAPGNPMQCTRCGLHCANPLMFNLHLLQTPHFP